MVNFARTLSLLLQYAYAGHIVWYIFPADTAAYSYPHRAMLYLLQGNQCLDKLVHLKPLEPLQGRSAAWLIHQDTLDTMCQQNNEWLRTQTQIRGEELEDFIPNQWHRSHALYIALFCNHKVNRSIVILTKMTPIIHVDSTYIHRPLYTNSIII